MTNQAVTITVATAGAPGTTSAPITAIPTGTVCTVTETTATGFDHTQPPQNITVVRPTGAPGTVAAGGGAN